MRNLRGLIERKILSQTASRLRLRALQSHVQSMNPFTKMLSARLQEQRLRDFIARWDALEALVVRVYRAQRATPEDEAEYERLRSWLLQHYAEWQAALEPHWRSAKRAGRLCQSDPFMDMLRPAQATEFVGSWELMQALPAAREALNRLIIERGA